jgi:hypothetical protein
LPKKNIVIEAVTENSRQVEGIQMKRDWGQVIRQSRMGQQADMGQPKKGGGILNLIILFIRTIILSPVPLTLLYNPVS